ncbi:MAG: PQQ-binding-like beta-propeller repeat protein [Acidobacteriota bacterium]
MGLLNPDGKIKPGSKQTSVGLDAGSRLRRAWTSGSWRSWASILVGLTILLPLALSQNRERDSWPQFRNTPNLAGVASAPLPDKLRLLWTYEAGESVESSAAIFGGTVFFGTQGGELVALDLHKGSLRWKYRTVEPIGESSPCVGDGRVFVGDLGGVLHAVEAGTGRGLWTFKTQSEIKSSPVLVGKMVLVGSYDEHLYCLSAETGKLVWKFRISGPVHCTAGVSEGLAYISGCDETFRAIRIADGKEAFNVPSEAYTGASPAFLGQTAYFGTFNNEVLAVDMQARRILWRYSHPQRHFPFYASVALAGDKVIAGGRDKMVHCLRAKTGEALWTFATRAKVDSSPAVAGDRVYVGSNDGRFYVLDLGKGTKVWEFNAGAPLSASPAIAEGRVVIGSQDGQVFCFGG